MYEQLPWKEFSKLLWRKVFRIGGYSMLFRFCLKLLFKRLNFIKAFKEPVPIIQFGIATALFNLIFHLVRRFIAQRRKALRNKQTQQ